jgi:hypothetical protein
MLSRGDYRRAGANTSGAPVVSEEPSAEPQGN